MFKTAIFQFLLLKSYRSISIVYSKEFHLNSNLCAATLKTLKIKEKTYSKKNPHEDVEESSLLSCDANDDKEILRISGKIVRQKLADIFSITSDEAGLLLANYPFIYKLTPRELKERYTLLTDNKVKGKILFKYPWILSTRKPELREKLKIIQSISMDINKTLPMIKQNRTRLLKSVANIKNEFNLIPEGNRIDFIGKHLKRPPDEVSYAIGRYSFFTNLKFDRVARILKILIDKDVPAENILNDFWIFKYLPATIETRLQAAVDSQVASIRTWMVRCKADVYNRTLQRHENNKKILGDLSDITEYLSKRLNLEYDYAKIIVDKHPEIKRMNSTKTKEILDYLFAEGFTTSQVIRSPRILCCKLKTIQERRTKLKELNFQPSSLVIFCKSQVQFDLYMQVLKRKISKQNKEKTT